MSGNAKQPGGSKPCPRICLSLVFAGIVAATQVVAVAAQAFLR